MFWNRNLNLFVWSAQITGKSAIALACFLRIHPSQGISLLHQRYLLDFQGEMEDLGVISSLIMCRWSSDEQFVALMLCHVVEAVMNLHV